MERKTPWPISRRCSRPVAVFRFLIIPDSVTEIGRSAFAYCDNLTTVRMEDSVTKIGWRAFGSCMKLTDIRLSNALTEIDGVIA